MQQENTTSDEAKQVWDLGDGTQYPVLKIDTNLDGNIDEEDIAAQR